MSGGATVLYPNVHSWRALYRAALFETDRTKLPERISNAEHAIVVRGRQLFGSCTDDMEDQALDDALYGLRALESCLGLNTTAA
ncbi:MAG: hypothetical protein WBW53_15935 [Terriglobales bacterium]